MADQTAATKGTPHRRRCVPGFTLIEVMLVVAILGILAALSFSVWFRNRPRADLTNYGVAVEQAIRNGRQQAMGRGRNVSVLFYGSLVTREGIGRVVVYVEDVNDAFVTSAAAVPNMDTWNALRAATGMIGRSEIVEVITLPRGLVFATPPVAMKVAYPFNLVPWPLNGCSFCSEGTVLGAIRFDMRGRAAFYAGAGLPGAWPNGGSVAVSSVDLRSSVVIMVTPFGIVRSYHVG